MRGTFGGVSLQLYLRIEGEKEHWQITDYQSQHFSYQTGFVYTVKL